MSKPESPRDTLKVKVPRGPTEESIEVTVSIDRKTQEALPYRGGFKDIRTGRYLSSRHIHLTLQATSIHTRWT